MTSDRIRIQGVQGKGFHGVLPEERQSGQPFIVDIELSVSLAAAGESDDLSQTVDYAAIAKTALAVIEGEPLNLIEAVAERIATAVLALGDIEEATVTVHKPEAPVGVPLSDVSVTVVRTS
jgi:dihydroneopterin aldolase / 2-amino-4-hydroxy-6-hydroxymethyldihydropteridine diphosphokinase